MRSPRHVVHWHIDACVFLLLLHEEVSKLTWVRGGRGTRLHAVCSKHPIPRIQCRVKVNYKLKRLRIQCKLRIPVALTEISSSISVFSTPRIQCKVKNQLQVTKRLYSMHVTNASSTDGDYYLVLARAFSDSFRFKAASANRFNHVYLLCGLSTPYHVFSRR